MSDTCKKCGVEKPLEDFRLVRCTKRGKHYRTHTCKDCESLCTTKYAETHVEDKKKWTLTAYQCNKPKYRKNRQKNTSKWAKNNREQVNDTMRAWHHKNPDKNFEYLERRRARKMGVNEHFLASDRQYAMDKFEHKCFRCGAQKNLTIDHLLPLSKGYALTRKTAVVLCRSCNSKKWVKLPQEFFSSDEYRSLMAKLEGSE